MFLCELSGVVFSCTLYTTANLARHPHTRRRGQYMIRRVCSPARRVCGCEQVAQRDDDSKIQTRDKSLPPPPVRSLPLPMPAVVVVFVAAFSAFRGPPPMAPPQREAPRMRRAPPPREGLRSSSGTEVHLGEDRAGNHTTIQIIEKMNQ